MADGCCHGTCKYYQNISMSINQGFCTAHPPYTQWLLRGGQIVQVTGYPKVDASGLSCGEYEPRSIVTD